jgi:predicted permease
VDAPIKTDAWVPIHMQRVVRSNLGSLGDKSSQLRDAGGTWIRMGGRMRPGVTEAGVHAELSTLAAAISAEGVEPEWMHRYTDMRVNQLTGLPPDATGPLGGFLGLLLGAAALVLLIASVNVAALLSARAVARQREMAVRAALGADRSRLIRQLLTEVLVLFGLGAVGGAVVAFAATGALEQIPIPGPLAMRFVLTPDLWVLAFALLISLATGVIVGLAPIRQAVRLDVEAQLRDGAGGGTARRSLGGSALVIVQLAVSLLLLVGAGLFVRALQRAGEIDPGFEMSGVATVPLDTETWGYDESQGRQFYQQLTRQVAALPGVMAVSYATLLPLNLQRSGDQIQLGATSDQPGDGVPIEQLLVGPEYFNVLRIPLLAGRAIGTEDNAEGAKVAVVNETMAHRFWPDGSALGRTFGYQSARVTVVGIVRDAKYASLDEATPALAYFPLEQQWRARRALVVRTATDPLQVAPLIQAAIRTTDPAAPRATVTTLAEASGMALVPQRVAAMVTGVLGVVGLLLSMAGLYGVIAYSAARRTREIGIRLALGARAADVLRMIVREGMVLIGAGVTLGLLLAAGATRLLSSLLLGVSPLDLGTYLLMPAILVAVALLASYLPARRAAATEPASVLKAQ